MPKGFYDRSKSKPRPGHSIETKIKIGNANRGKKRTPAQIENIKNSLPQNRTISAWHKMRVGQANMGKRSKNWKGGKYLVGGYRRLYLPQHPFAECKGYVFEHRVIMEKHIGRYLTRNEIIHHINGIKTDNRIENLVLCKSTKEHKAYHKRHLT